MKELLLKFCLGPNGLQAGIVVIGAVLNDCHSYHATEWCHLFKKLKVRRDQSYYTIMSTTKFICIEVV